MAPLCILYFLLVGTWLGAAGVLLERALPAPAPRRWIWCVTIVASMALPMALSVRHSSHVIELWGLELLRVPSAAPLPGAGSETSLGTWLDCAAPLGGVIMRLWIGGALVLVTWGAVSALRLRRLMRPQGAMAARLVVDGVTVTLTDTLGPAAAGLLRPRVLVPRWVLALPAERRRYVIRHEDEHRRSRDAALVAAASLLVALMPWNLALWWHLRRLRLAVEMDCDRRVVAALGDAAGYGELLLDVAQASSRGPRLQPALLGGSGMLERRLIALVGTGRRGVVEWVVAPVAAIALVAAVLSVPHPEMGRASAPHGITPAGTQTRPTTDGSPPATGVSRSPHHTRER